MDIEELTYKEYKTGSLVRLGSEIFKIVPFEGGLSCFCCDLLDFDGRQCFECTSTYFPQVAILFDHEMSEQ